MKRPLYYVLCLVLVVGGAVLALVQIKPLKEYHRIRSWSTVQGIVVQSDVVGERAFYPRVVYQYQIDSVSYESVSDLHAPMFGGKRKKYDVARDLASEHSVGSPVTVYFNPDSAAQSTIVPSVTWNTYGQLALGLTLCLLGILGLTPSARGLFFGF